MKRLAIIGAGAWGTALSTVLAPRFESVTLWMHETDLAARAQTARTNDVFLPGVRLADNLTVTSSLESALDEANVVLGVMPSHVARELYSRMAASIPATAHIVSATKGLEAGTHLRISQVISGVLGPERPVAVLSGPSFAKEVAAGSPTALVAASTEDALAAIIQTSFSGPTFRVYASRDVVGVEIGGALKNVIAIGAGIVDGLGLGHNALAALITRGLAELTRLSVAAGGRPETLAGLAGLGDLVLTCTGDLSRNRQVGLKLARGMQLGEIMSGTTTVAEGVRTTAVALELAASYQVDLPITAEMHAVLNQGRPPAEAIRNLMTRSLRSE